MGKHKIIARDISWLAFNGRVLQEAADETVPLNERIRFLGIFSNNLDEFFRVRVATLKRMMQVGMKARMHLEVEPEKILQKINLVLNWLTWLITRSLRIKQKDISKINDKSLLDILFEVILSLKKAEKLNEIPNIIKLNLHWLIFMLFMQVSLWKPRK